MKGIIFDLDGTLIDSMPVWKNISKIYIESKGATLTEDIAQKMSTMSLNMNATFLKEHFNFQESVEEIYSEIGSIVRKYYSHIFELKPHVIESLNTFKEMGFKMCLGTVTNEEFLAPALNRFKMNEYFDFIQTCENVGISKNNREFFQIAAKRMGIKTQETYLFDDASYALKAAKLANIVTVAVYDSASHNMWEENKQISDYHIMSFRDWFKKGYL